MKNLAQAIIGMFLILGGLIAFLTICIAAMWPLWVAIAAITIIFG